MKSILITCYVNPDLDGYAGIFAYAELLEKSGSKVTAGIMGQPHDEVLHVLKKFQLEPIEEIADDDRFDKVILVDASDIIGLEGRIKPEKVIEIIDHRQVNEADKFINAKAQIELVGAAATLIAEKFKQKNIAISPQSASLLYSAIISNTLNFKGGVTTNRDREMASWLKPLVQVTDDYWKELFMAKSDLGGERLRARLESDFAWFNFKHKKLGIAQIEIIGAQELVNSRLEEILAALEGLRSSFGLDFVFLNLIELELEKNYFVSNDEELKSILEKVLAIKFTNTVAQRDKLIMRKQIVPLIKEELEKTI